MCVSSCYTLAIVSIETKQQKKGFYEWYFVGKHCCLLNKMEKIPQTTASMAFQSLYFMFYYHFELKKFIRHL